MDGSLSAKVSAKVLLIGIGRTTLLLLGITGLLRHAGERLAHGLVQFRLDGIPALHAADLV